MFANILLLLGVLSVATMARAGDDMKCAFCSIAMGLLVEDELQIKLKNKLVGKCEDKKFKLEKKICLKAVDKIIVELAKKGSPDALCNKINMCKGYETCKLYPEWPNKSLPAKQPEWPVERRLSAADKIKDIVEDITHPEKMLKNFFEEMIQKYILPDIADKDDHKGFYIFTRVLVALLQELKDKKSDDDSASPYDKCATKDIKCKMAAVGKHLPLQDHDGDRFSSVEKQLRGTHWRGTDCNDLSDEIYPGRKQAFGKDGSVLAMDIDHNCNGVVGGNSTASYEDMFCKDSQQKGLIMLGDSATAHFHLPPQWMTANGWNMKQALKDAEDEMDFPQCSWGTGHETLDKCPFQDKVPGVPTNKALSIYSQLRERNRCMNNDFQNIGVNGARMSAADGLVEALARNSKTDHPVMLWLSLIGNDVCNGHEGYDHMNTPEKFEEQALAALQKIDQLLPKGSVVVSLGLFQGAYLYDIMHDQQHPLGTKYKYLYDYLNCLGVSPCWGWLNSDADVRKKTQDRADSLNDVYTKIASTAKFENFQYLYYSGDYVNLFESFRKEMGEDKMVTLIEKSDGFHPSQAGNALFAKGFFAWLEKNHPDALGPINPHNAEMDQLFFTQKA